MAMKSSDQTQKRFFSGVLLLTLSTVSVKVLGLIYKIPMLAFLGAEGMGYFNSAYEIYALFCVISTAGLPVAVSVLISGAIARGEGNSVDRIYRASLIVFLTIGVLGSGAMLLFARHLCNLIQSDLAYLSMISIAPTVLLICISSAIRGYFQGHQQMLPTAISQLIESLGKLIFGLGLASYAVEKGYDIPVVAAYAGIGLSLGTLLSVLYLAIKKMLFSLQKPQKVLFLPTYRSVWKSLAILAVPMTLGASMVSVTKLVDMTMVLRRLQSIGYTEALANEAYGSYTTLALSVFGLIPTLLNAIALPLIPMLSGAIAEKNQPKQKLMIGMTYRLTAIFSIPAALALSAFARPILLLLFGHDPSAVSTAAPLLSYLGVSVFLSCMITATNSVLHAYQIVNRPILAMLAGAVVKMISAYFLIGNPSIGILGAPISTFLCNLVIVLLNLSFASRLYDVDRLLGFFVRPLVAATGAVGLGAFAYRLALRWGVGEGLLLLPVLGGVAILYFILACRIGAITQSDMLAMPFGTPITRFLRKIRLIKEKPQVFGGDGKDLSL